MRRGIVDAVGEPRGGGLHVDVQVEGERAKAIVFPAMVGMPVPGDRVLLNTTARTLGLGTGGVDLVVAIEGRDALGDPPADARTMKARYTPQQAVVTGVEESHGPALEALPGLGQIPIVAAPLHSLIAPVAAGARAAGAERVVYVMTDGAALPAPLSRLLADLRAAGLLSSCITVGQAFGGDLEAVTLWSGLLASVAVADADVIVVADGPGNLGSATTWGVSALSSGLALNAAALLGGSPVAALRISFADERERHRGLSHHSRTILGKVCTVETNVAVPLLEDPERQVVWDHLRAERLEERHRLVEADGRPALEALEEAGVRVTSMGRTPGDDPAFFLAGGAAGVLAGRMAAGNRRWRKR